MLSTRPLHMLEDTAILLVAAVTGLTAYDVVGGLRSPRALAEDLAALLLVAWALKVHRARWAGGGRRLWFWVPLFAALAYASVRTFGMTPAGLAAAVSLLAVHAAVVWYVVRRCGATGEGGPFRPPRVPGPDTPAT